MGKSKRFLLLGLFGALLGTAAELLGGWAPAVEGSNPMAALLASLTAVPVPRLGLCSTLGGIGILLQFFGYHGIYLSFEDRENLRGRLYLGANFGFTIIGAVYHILCCVFLFLLHLGIPEPENTAVLSQFLIWFCLPLTILFFLSYLTVCLLLLLQIGFGHSSYPRWVAFFNPLLLNIFIQILTALLPGSALMNALGFAAMGLTSILIFTVLLLIPRR